MISNYLSRQALKGPGVCDHRRRFRGDVVHTCEGYFCLQMFSEKMISDLLISSFRIFKWLRNEITSLLPEASRRSHRPVVGCSSAPQRCCRLLLAVVLLHSWKQGCILAGAQTPRREFLSWSLNIICFVDHSLVMHIV